MMTQAKINICRCFGMLICITVLFGCASLELKNGDWADVEEQTTQTEDSTAPIEDDSGRIEQIGNNGLTGQEFEKSAADKPSPEKEELLLYAVSAYLDEQNLYKAGQLLEQTDQAQLPQRLYLRQQVLYAALYIKQNNHGQARRIIEDLKDYQSDDSVFNDLLRLARAQLNIDDSNFLDSLELLSSNLTTENNRTLDSQNQAVWLFVTRQNLETLEAARRQTTDELLLGWIELGIINKKRGQIAQPLWQQSVDLWADSYADHPASAIHEQLSSLPFDALDQPALQSSNRIALLLPLSSSYAEIAEEIRDGFVAAGSAQGTTVRIYDTGTGTDNLIQAYQQAVFEGAQIIVGPLGKIAVNYLANTNLITQPTLLLGSVTLTQDGMELPAQAFMYSLDPEHEAESLAQQIYNRGYTRAAVLYPDSVRGRRLNNAFVQRWRQYGGAVTSSIVYPNDLYDAEEPVNRLMNTASIAPDVIFLASNSQQGRLLSQMINKRQPDSTIFATSSIYSGQPEPTRDFVLNNVIFTDMPWMIEGFSRVQFKKQELTQDKINTSDSLSRFFAFGVDAYTLASRLTQFINQPGVSINGVTGTIQLIDNRFSLTRPLVQFVDGSPIPITGY